jgi:hypothetical protein
VAPYTGGIVGAITAGGNTSPDGLIQKSRKAKKESQI